MSSDSAPPAVRAARERGLIACGGVALAVGVVGLERVAAWLSGDPAFLEVPERRLLLRIVSGTGLGLGVALILARRWLAARLIPLLAAGAVLALLALLVLAADLWMSYRAISQPRPGESTQGLHEPDPELGWLPRPGGVGRHVLEGNFDVEYRIDAEGFREVPYSPAARRRLWLFGDSFTFGTSVSGEDAYPNRIARDWVGDRVRVINAAVSGYGLVQMYGRLLRLRERLRPGDAVVFAMISEDLLRTVYDPVFFSHLLFREQGDQPLRLPAWAGGRLESVAVDGAWSRLRGLLLHAPLTEDLHRFLHRAVTGSAWRSVEEARALVDEARELCAERGVGFLLVFLPRARELQRGRYKVDVSSFDYADIRTFFPTDAAELEALRFPDDFHWTPRGHEIGAAALVSVLLERGLLQREELRAEVALSSGTAPRESRP
jgi:lysophospholipase L1-like esterase